MNLDATTLIVAGSFVVTLGGLLLLGARAQIPKAPALLWWGAANLVYAAGIVSSAFPIAVGGEPVQRLGIAMLALSTVMVWAGFRHFNRRLKPSLVASAAVLVVLATLGAFSQAGPASATLVAFVASLLFFAASIYELWRERHERLRARWPLLVLLAINMLVYAGSIDDIAAGRFVGNVAPAPSSWFGLIYFEGLVYIVGTVLFMVLLAKERAERRYVVAAHEDPLTGIANRRALLEDGERLLRRCQTDGRSFSLIMFDLDRFKWVNDTFGHAAGDAVLRAFASTMQSALRPNDVCGRYGGEEFVVMLPGATIEAAFVIAERIRNGFASLPIAFGDDRLWSSVSAGVASATSAAMSLDAIMKVADDCLYSAKALGRNRVERPAKLPETSPAAIVRIA